MMSRLAAFAAPVLLSIAACGGSAESEVTPYSSAAEACDAFYQTLRLVPSEAPAVTSEGLRAWAPQIRIAADSAARVAAKTEGTDAILFELMRAASDGWYDVADVAEQAASNPKDVGLIAPVVTESAEAIKAVTTACSGP